MFALRLARCAVLFAALVTGCASAATSPATSGYLAESASVPREASIAASYTLPATDPAVRLSGNGPLAAGNYYLDDRHFTNASRLTFTVPAGWTTEEYGELYKDRGGPGEVKFITWVLTHVFSDVCQWGALVDAGTTVDQFVSAVVAQEGREASAPMDVSVGGFPATRIDLTVPADLETASCTNDVLRYWPGPGPDMSDGDCCNPPGNTDSVYVVDVAGKRLVIIARYYPGSSAEDRAELEGIVDSIEIEP